jgi:hypothetical protein
MELRRGLFFRHRRRILRLPPVVESLVAHVTHLRSAISNFFAASLSDRNARKRRLPCNAKLPQFGRAT